MRAWLLSLLILLPWMPARAGDKFASIAFHDVVDFKGDLDDDAVTVDRLIGFFEWLRANHWTAISIDDLEASRLGKKALPKNPILITFDDGLRSLYTRVFPLVLAYRIPIVAAIGGSWVDAPMDSKVRYGDREVPRANFISREEAQEMAHSGLVEFASHGYGIHRTVRGNPEGNELPSAITRRYTPGSGYESEDSYRRRVRDDLRKSRDLHADRIGRAPRVMVWPYGRYNTPTVEIAKELGFRYALTLDPAPADAARPMAVGRYLPTNDPQLATVVSNIRFEDPLPAAQRFVGVDPAAIWTGDAAGTDARLGAFIERLRTLGATAIVIEGAIVGPDGQIMATWFPNDQLPMHADILSRICWQCESRAGVTSYVRLPATAALRTLGHVEKVRTLFRDLGTYVPVSGMFIDDAPELIRAGASRSRVNTPWDTQDIRRSIAIDSLPSREALALRAFRAVEYFRPSLQLALVVDSTVSQPAGIADVTLIPVSPKSHSAERIGKRLQDGGWLTVPASRSVGLWFVGDRPPRARDLIPATRRFQRLGGTVIGWSIDDPARDLPNAKTVAPTVSAATFPKKF